MVEQICSAAVGRGRPVTATAHGPAPAPDSPRPVGTRPLPVAPPAPIVRTRRRPALLALGLALVATGALAAGWMVVRAGDRVGVVVMVRDVPYGTALSPADLAVTEVSADPSVATVPAGSLGELVGQVAAVPLSAGMLVAPGSVGPARPPVAGQVLVAVALPATRMPVGGLAAEDRVQVVSTPSRDGELPAEVPTTIDATVVRLGAPDLDGVTVVDLSVAPGDGALLAAWSATGRVALVLQPAGQ